MNAACILSLSFFNNHLLCSSAVSRSRAGGSADVKRGHPSAVPAEVRQKLQDLADTRTNKNQWEFKDFKKEVSDALAESAKQHPSEPEVPMPCRRTLQTMLKEICLLTFSEGDQQNLGRYIAAVDMCGQASMVGLLPVLYKDKNPALIMNLDASNVKISVGSPPDKKPKVHASRKAAASVKKRGVGVGKTGKQQFKFRTAKFLTLISQRNLVNATYVLKAKSDTDKINKLHMYTVRGLSNRGPEHKGHIIVVPKNTPLQEVVQMHLEKVVIPSMKHERKLVAQQKARARVYAAVGEDEEASLSQGSASSGSSPREIIDPADLEEPMALLIDGEKITLDVVSDNLKRSFEEAFVDTLKGYKRATHLWQPNDQNKAGYRAVKRVCMRASEELGDMFLSKALVVPPPDEYMAQINPIVDAHYTGIDAKM